MQSCRGEAALVDWRVERRGDDDDFCGSAERSKTSGRGGIETLAKKKKKGREKGPKAMRRVERRPRCKIVKQEPAGSCAMVSISRWASRRTEDSEKAFDEIEEWAACVHIPNARPPEGGTVGVCAWRPVTDGHYRKVCGGPPRLWPAARRL